VLSGVWLAPLYYWRKRLYRHANAVVAVADDYLNLAKRLTDRPGVIFETVYWSYDDRAHAGNPDASPAVTDFVARKNANEIWVVYAGTLGENYDITSIIDAAKWLVADVGDQLDFKFVVAGDGPLKALCEASVSAHFSFLGRLGPADLDVLFRHCDLALTTYKGESTVAMPIKAFDYFFHGLPIVNSLGRDLGRFVRDRRVGTNYDAASPSSLHEAIKRLMLDAELRKTCARNAKILSEEFTPDKQYSKFASVLERLAR